MIDKKFVILAGGKGTRLLPYTELTHKTLTTIGGIPLLGYHIDTIGNLGVKPEDICIITGYMGEEVEGYLKRYYHGVQYIRSLNSKKGPAGGVLSAADFIGDNWSVVIEGDVYLEDLTSLKENKQKVFVKLTEMEQRYAQVHTDSYGILKGLDLFSNNNRTNGFAYAGLTVNPPGFCKSLEKVTPHLATGEHYILDGVLIQNKITPYQVKQIPGFWANVATIDDVRKIRNHILKKSSQSLSS